jgi:hypothetical protein
VARRPAGKRPQRKNPAKKQPALASRGSRATEKESARLNRSLPVPIREIAEHPGSVSVTDQSAAVDDTREGIAAAVASKEAPSPPAKLSRQEVYVLFSYDLVNSTAYKIASRDRWPPVISYFYQLIEGGLQKWLGGDVKRWKYVGDELLLYRRVRSIDDIRGCLGAAHQVLKDAINRLYDRFPETRALLSVKAVVWCASVHQIPPQDINIIERSVTAPDAEPVFRNILLPSESLGGSVDFLGPEIDVGFRLLARGARRYRLTIGSDLALLLHMDHTRNGGGADHDSQRLRIVGYQPLKGIWSGRRYPIIWYEPDWRDVKGTFMYDERFQSRVVARIARMANPATQLERLEDLVKVANDVGRLRYVDGVFNFIQGLTPASQLSVPGALQPPNIAEVHCVAACVRGDGRVLIAKRPTTKSRYPGYWEFGCGQLEPGETFEECLRRSYREDFNAQLSFFGHDPRPINTFTIPRKLAGSKPIPGIIFLAALDNPAQIMARRHGQIDWVDPLNSSSWPEGDKVSDFSETLRLASAAILDLRPVSPAILRKADPSSPAKGEKHRR